jgi:hypothetical protein
LMISIRSTSAAFLSGSWTEDMVRL